MSDIRAELAAKAAIEQTAYLLKTMDKIEKHLGNIDRRLEALASGLGQANNEIIAHELTTISKLLHAFLEASKDKR